MTTWLKIAAVALLASAVFLAGYWFAAQGYKRDIAEMIADYERRAKDVQEAMNGKLLEERESHARAVSELLAKNEALSARSRDSAVRADRLQRELAARAKVSGAASGACGSCEQRYARCSELLAEGVELAQEGGALAERIAVRKDALSELMKY